jgi:DNA-binding beta-propeller fold protein YncE
VPGHRRLAAVAATALSLLLVSSPPEARETRSAPAPHLSPLDVTVDDHGQIARVALPLTRQLAIVDLTTGKVREIEAWPAGTRCPEPTDVSRHLPPDVKPAYEARPGAPGLPDAGNIRGMCAIPGKPFVNLILVAHQRPKFRIPATQVAQGWIFTNVLTLVPVPELADQGHPLAHTLPLDEPNRFYADPSDVVVSPDGQRAYVACAGADTVVVVDVKRFRKYVGRNARYTEETAQVDLIEDLAASRHYVLARLPTGANPRRLGLSGDGKTLVASNYLGDSLTVIDAVNLQVVSHIPLVAKLEIRNPKSETNSKSEIPNTNERRGVVSNLGNSNFSIVSDFEFRNSDLRDSARRGEILFNSAKITFQGQFTCASCHPNGGADGLNWDLPRDGIGNFKNTKSLLGVKDTAPYGWLGTSPTLADRVLGTLRSVHRHEPSAEEVADLVAYLESLPPPKPPPIKAEDKAAALRGQSLFEGKARCNSCHSGPAGDDGKIHDIGTGTFPGEDRFNTASLRGLSQTAPYLHDGSAATLEEVFTKRNPKEKHGDAHRLSPEEFRDLIAYLRGW